MNAAVGIAVIAAAIAVVTVLLVFGAGVLKVEWCRSVFRAWDYLGAAILGGDGRHSISAYCGALDTPIHRAARVVIDGVFGEGHCIGAAKHEGLL